MLFARAVVQQMRSLVSVTSLELFPRGQDLLHECQSIFEATYVTRPLISFAKAVQEGQTIWFSPTSSGMALASTVHVQTSADYVPLNPKSGV